MHSIVLLVPMSSLKQMPVPMYEAEDISCFNAAYKSHIIFLHTHHVLSLCTRSCTRARVMQVKERPKH